MFLLLLHQTKTTDYLFRWIEIKCLQQAKNIIWAPTNFVMMNRSHTRVNLTEVEKVSVRKPYKVDNITLYFYSWQLKTNSYTFFSHTSANSCVCCVYVYRSLYVELNSCILLWTETYKMRRRFMTFHLLVGMRWWWYDPF